MPTALEILTELAAARTVPPPPATPEVVVVPDPADLAATITRLSIQARAEPEAVVDVSLAGHDAVRDEVEAYYRQKLDQALGTLQAQTLAEMKEDKEAREKRRKRQLAALALLLLLAGVKMYKVMKRKLAPFLAPGAPGAPISPSGLPGAQSTAAPPSGLSGGGLGPMPGPIEDEDELEQEAKGFADTRAAFLLPWLTKAGETFERTAEEDLAEGWTDSEIADHLTSIGEHTSKTAAITETQATYGNAGMRLLRQAGFATKIWTTMEDERVRPSHVACGEQGEVPMDKPFLNGLMYPGDPKGGPEEVCNCRCWLTGGQRIPGTGHLKASNPHGYNQYSLMHAPALRFPNGEVRKAIGDERSHEQIYHRLLKQNHPNLLHRHDPDIEEGWVDSENKFHTREEVSRHIGYSADTFTKASGPYDEHKHRRDAHGRWAQTFGAKAPMPGPSGWRPEDRKSITPEHIQHAAKWIASLPEEERGNMELTGAVLRRAAILHEAQRMAPVDKGPKFRRATEANSFYGANHYSHFANVHGVLFGLNQDEDPDDEEKTVWSFERLDDPAEKRTQTTSDNPTEAYQAMAESLQEQADNVPEKKRYVYRSPMRPVMSISQYLPKGWKLHGEVKDIKEHRDFSTDRHLTIEEVNQWELEPADPNHPVNIKKAYTKFHDEVMDKYAEKGALRMTFPEGSSIIVSETIDDEKYPFRITRFLADGRPSGHETFRDFNEVTRYLFGFRSTGTIQATEAGLCKWEENLHPRGFGGKFSAKPEDYGLAPMKGMLGRMGYHGSTDPSVRISAQIDPKSIFVTRMDAVEPGKGAGSKALSRIKDFATATNRRVELTAGADTPELQPKLNAFYERHGFKRTDDAEHPSFTWEPDLRPQISGHDLPEGYVVKAKDIDDTEQHGHVVIFSGQPNDLKVACIYNPTQLPEYSLPGGHVKMGESLGEGTRREVMEETRLQVDELTPVDGMPWMFFTFLAGQPEMKGETPADYPAWIPVNNLPEIQMIIDEVRAAVASLASVQPGLVAEVQAGLPARDLGTDMIYAVEVREHSRVSKTGKVAFVHRYQDKRQKHSKPLQQGPGADLAPYGVRLKELMGFSVVSILRRLGKEGVTPAQAKAIFAAKGIAVNPGTVYIQISAGRKGQGSMASLSDDQLKELLEAMHQPPQPEPPKPPVKEPVKPKPPKIINLKEYKDHRVKEGAVKLTMEQLRTRTHLTIEEAYLCLRDKVVGANKMSPTDRENFYDVIRNSLFVFHPKALRALVKNVRRIASVDQKEIDKTFPGQANKYIAFYNPKEKLVASADFEASTMCHEFAHAIDRRKGNARLWTAGYWRFTGRKQFKKAWEQDCIHRKDPKQLRHYAKTNVLEGLAVACETAWQHGGVGQLESGTNPTGTGLMGRAPNIAKLLVKWEILLP